MLNQAWMAGSNRTTEVNSRNEIMHVLIVDDHAFVCVGLKATLSEEIDDIQVTTTDHGDTALKILAKENIDLAIVDLFMPGGAGGFNFIEMLCESYPKLPSCLLSFAGALFPLFSFPFPLFSL